MRTLVVAAVCAGLAVLSTPLAANDYSVTTLPNADFSAYRTFALRETRIVSPRPEIDNPLFAKRLTAAIREGLLSRGLQEASDAPDLVVDYSLTNEDIDTIGTNPRGPLRYTQAALVVDLKKPNDSTPLWRGVYRDDQKAGSKMVEKLPPAAKKLVSRYPRRPS